MNIEEAIEYLKLKIKKDNLTIQGMFGDIYEEIQKDNKAIETLLTAYEKEKEKNNNAYRKANNYLYFNDSADYEVALWEVIRKLRPDLAEKWDNGEDVDLEYIEEE